MAVGDIYRVRVLSYVTVLQQIGLNNMYYLETATTGTGATPSQIADAVDAVMAPLYKPIMSGVAHYRGVSAQKIAPGGPLVPSVTSGRDGAGTGGPTLEPAQDSYVVALKTALSGRHFQGRIYPPFVPIACNDGNGQLTAPAIAALVTFAAGITPPIAAGGAGPNTSTLSLTVRAVRPQPAPAPPLISYGIVVQAIARTRFGTQRRRGQYGRLNPLPW